MWHNHSPADGDRSTCLRRSSIIYNCHIRSLRHIRPLIDRETAVDLACSIVASRLDYCNSVLYGVGETYISKRHRMQK